MLSRMSHFMTPTPITVTQDLPLRESIEMMEFNRIRHLPVEYSGVLVGVLLYEDARHALACETKRLIKVEDVMHRQPFTVHPNDPLKDVVLEMAQTKRDYVIVEEDSKIIGIFTTTDALKILSERLEHEQAAA